MTTIPIFNLSSQAPDQGVYLLLSKGLSYVPHSGLNKFELFSDMTSFFRKIRLMDFFSNTENSTGENNKSGLAPKSIFTPTLEQVTPEIHIFEQIVMKKLRAVTKYIPKTPYNLTLEEYSALKSLKESTSITVKGCDKGGGIAILDTSNYTAKIENMLNDNVFYNTISKDPTAKIRQKIQILTSKALNSGDICQKEYDYLNVSKLRMACLYGTPKVHKNEVDPPFRPIVNTIGSITEPLSKYLDAILRPYISKIPGYVKDTGHIINLLEGTAFNEKRQWLVTLDVESLYSNIPIDGAISATEWFINTYEVDCNKIFILDCLKIVLEENVFEFRRNLYKQTKGVSMGASCAPTIANIYMAQFENIHVFNEISPFFEIILHWSRYIDDVIFIWDDNEDILNEFILWLNACDRNLRFTSHISNIDMEFLDITIKHDQGQIFVDLYVKPTARNTLLHYKSFCRRVGSAIL
ncbi:uncharacterized protein LOC144783188 [Lissotriton helveticus]